MNGILASTLVAACAGHVLAGGTLIMQFDLQDHPDANDAPPPYGLRADGIIAPGHATLSINQFSDTVLRVFDDGGVMSFNISGTLWGGAIENNAYIDPEAYTIDMNYVVGVVEFSNGWNVNEIDPMNFGTLTRVSDNTDFEIYTTGQGDTGTSLRFRSDGHRLDNDDSTWVGRGWITDQSDGSDPLAGARDWLFTAIEREIPAPGALALLGLGGLVSVRRRR